ncbi:hypothetical protein GY45DRAFT_1251771 [Cubamyces sp. BRFM 1775]|nr:hypothetical protein GY45DRAFT_1251771 [Cubamyces sp. BRFM 1775]
MLSAVAARKARLAQSQTRTLAPEAKATAAPSPSSPEPQAKAAPAATKPSSSSQKPPSKRKPSTSAGNPSTKKKKSQHRKGPQDSQPGRYFAQADAFKTQEDLIVVDESDSESSAASSSAESDKDWARARPAAQSKAAGKRAWSPSAPLADSSDEEQEEDEQVLLDVSTPAAVDPSPDTPTVLSTFQPILDQNVFRLPPSQSSSSNSRQGRTVLLLRASESVALLGAYTLTVLRGAVSLGGILLPASSTTYPVFAPRSSPLPIIQCLPRRAFQLNTLDVVLPANVAEAASNSDAAIMLQELHTGIEGLGRICRTFDGFFAPSRWWRNQARFDLGLDHVYFLPFQTPDMPPLVIPPTWTKATSAVLPSSNEDVATQRRVCLIKGPKNAGKSTFAKFLMNTLLSRYRRVAYLECDIGQSEFTPGGMVSLNVVEKPVFGPPFSHPSIPFTAHYIGATSPRSSPSHYLDSIQALVQQYEIDVQNAILDEEPHEEDGRISSMIPLVVNTMGWTKGLGADLARKVEEIIGPTDLFSIVGVSQDDEPAYGSAPSQIPAHVHGPRVHLVETVHSHPSASHYTAADHRNLSILSYLHAIFPREAPPSPYVSAIATAWNTTTPLCAQAPYEVDGSVAFDKLILTGAGMEDVVPDNVHRALNCAIVGLVSCEPGTLETDAQPEDGLSARLAYEQGAPPPLPTASRCLGLALVRAIGPGPKTPVQLLTPVPPPLLSSARVLMMGELQLPVWGMLDFRTLDDSGEIAGYERGKVPYLRWGKGEGAGGERRRVRRNLMRKGQM